LFSMKAVASSMARSAPVSILGMLVSMMKLSRER
jgi:hypothetical protein